MLFRSRPVSVWVAPGEGATDIAALAARLGAKVENGESPGADALCIVTPLGEDATTAVVRLGLDAKRTVALDPLFGVDSHRCLMTTPATDARMRDAAHGLFAGDGTPVTIVHDSPGFVAQRVVAMIVSIGCDIAQQGIATPDDIDRAVVLGLGYPFGPLAWGDRLGPAKVLKVLETMHVVTGDPRYRPSLWLKRRALLGLSLLTPEN